MKIAVFCVGNRLMLDDGIGPAVYDEIVENYHIPEEVDFFDLGCMTMDMITMVGDYDLIITVDSIDGTGAEPGTVFRYKPGDLARASGFRSSLHELRLADLFDAAFLLGYSAEGLCYGMQVENLEPDGFIEGLTPKVFERLPFLVESVVAELHRRGYPLTKKNEKD